MGVLGPKIGRTGQRMVMADSVRTISHLQRLIRATAHHRIDPAHPGLRDEALESLRQLEEDEPELLKRLGLSTELSPRFIADAVEQNIGRVNWYAAKAPDANQLFTARPTNIRPRPQYIPISIHGKIRTTEETLPSDAKELLRPRLAEEMVLRHALEAGSPERLITIASHAANGPLEPMIKAIGSDLEKNGRRMAYFNLKSSDGDVLSEFGKEHPADVIVVDQITARPTDNRDEFLDVLSDHLNASGEHPRKVVLTSGQRGTTQGQMRVLQHLTRNVEDMRFMALPQHRREIIFRAQALNFPQALNYLCQSAKLSEKDALIFTKFVTDRIEAYPGLLRDYKLPEGIITLEEALHFFVERFRDEARSKALLFGAQLLAIDHDEKLIQKFLSGLHFFANRQGSIPNFFHDFTVASRHVVRDAAFVLDQAGHLESARTPLFRAYAEAKDPDRKPLRMPDFKQLDDVQARYPKLTREAILECYEEACRERIRSEKILEDKRFKFAICDPGHEIHGTFAALALDHVVNPDAFAFAPHYRSGSAVGMWYRLRGREDYHLQYLRQQFSKDTDEWGQGRQTASHFMGPNIIPSQSAVGMNIDKGVGAARYLQEKHKDAVVYVEFGNGTESTSNFWQGAVGSKLMGLKDDAGFKTLPVILNEIDNGMAISVDSQDGQALEKKRAFAEAIGAKFYTYDANDPLDVYTTMHEAATWAKENQRPVFIWGQNFMRPNYHSSATPNPYDLKQPDPLLYLGHNTVARGWLTVDDVVQRKKPADERATSFFAHHALGRIGEDARQYVTEIYDKVAAEPEPDEDSVHLHIRLPLPEVKESRTENRPTVVTTKAAYRASYDVSLERNKHIWMHGQDVNVMGDVAKVTAGHYERHDGKITDDMINEVLTMGASIGYGMQPDAIVIPCMQFGDYLFSAFAEVVYTDRFLWMTAGKHRLNLKLRLPVNPLSLGGGANYHSTMLERFFNPFFGWTVIAPSTSADAYGLTLTAINDFEGPVATFEQKGLYPTAVGDAIPGEPTEPDEIALFQSMVAARNAVPQLDPNFRIPLGKAAKRREGSDLTIVTWGQASLHALAGAEQLQKDGLSADVIDLRTILPWDKDAVFESVGKTKSLLIVHDDNVTGSLGESIHSQVARKMQSDLQRADIVGALDVPAIPQNPKLEKYVRPSAERVYAAAINMLN